MDTMTNGVSVLVYFIPDANAAELQRSSNWMYVEGGYSAARRSWGLSLKYDGVESMDRRMTYWTSIFGTSCSIYREPRTWRPPTLPLALCAVSAARDEVDVTLAVVVVDEMKMEMIFCCLTCRRGTAWTWRP